MVSVMGGGEGVKSSSVAILWNWLSFYLKKKGIEKQKSEKK